MAGRVLHCRFDQQRAPRPGSGAVRQNKRAESDRSDTRPSSSVLPCDGSRFELRDVHSQRLDGNIGAIHRFAEKVVGADSPSHMIARTITVPRRRAIAGEINRDFELRQHIAVHVTVISAPFARR